MIEKILSFKTRPALYEPGSSKFWDDEHISKGMLEAHLDPERSSATRKLEFVEKSVDWIASAIPPRRYPRLLDLGCGPGIYAERLCGKGYEVTGWDLSERSIEYARRSAQRQGLNIRYRCGDYLGMEEENAFDAAVLIYCDFGALSETAGKKLLANTHRALTAGGKLLFDVFTPRARRDQKETESWSCQDQGFWSPRPHLCLNSRHIYDGGVFLDRTIVVTDDSVVCHNIWERTFELEELKRILRGSGFGKVFCYGDIAGAPYDSEGETICVLAEK